MPLDQTLVNWQVAPAEHEVSYYDDPKIKYRRYVENFIKPLPAKSVKKKTFYTIATNVLCADIWTSKDTIDPIDRDLYLPLEISLTKWSLQDGKSPRDTRELSTKVWMINPGPPVKLCNHAAMEHLKNHKIDFDYRSETRESNALIEEDLVKVMKEINSFLSADKTVFSQNILHIRQDLGVLKWLNRETNYKSKPILVYSLEDLYVVLAKFFNPDHDNTSMGQGIARHKLSNFNDSYNPDLQCIFHRVKTNNDDEGSTSNCAQAISIGYSHVIIDDIYTWLNCSTTT